MVRPEPKCYGCKRRFPAADLRHGKKKKQRRCGACQRNAHRWGTGLPKRRVCERDQCGARACCFPYKSGALLRWLCLTCLRIAQVATGRIITRLPRRPTKKEAELLTDQHLVQSDFVDMWVIATWPTCLYVLMRIIMWCREGRFAAMLPSADGVWRRNHNKSGPDFFVNVGALATHLFSLHTGGRWPDGSAPIILGRVVFCGCGRSGHPEQSDRPPQTHWSGRTHLSGCPIRPVRSVRSERTERIWDFRGFSNGRTAMQNPHSSSSACRPIRTYPKLFTGMLDKVRLTRTIVLHPDRNGAKRLPVI
jgi:hypothetical protein